jgi:hypothetical protein
VVSAFVQVIRISIRTVLFQHKDRLPGSVDVLQREGGELNQRAALPSE